MNNQPLNKPTLCLYGTSPSSTDPKSIEAAKKIGQLLAIEGFNIIYGGGIEGTMGALAKSAADHGAHVTAIILEKDKNEAQIPTATHIHVKTEIERFRALTSSKTVHGALVFPSDHETVHEAKQALESAIYNDDQIILTMNTRACLDRLKLYAHTSLETGLDTPPQRGDKLKRCHAEQSLKALFNPAKPVTAPRKKRAPRRSF